MESRNTQSRELISHRLVPLIAALRANRDERGVELTRLPVGEKLEQLLVQLLESEGLKVFAPAVQTALDTCRNEMARQHAESERCYAKDPTLRRLDARIGRNTPPPAASHRQPSLF